MSVSVADAPKEHNFSVEQIPNKDSVRVRCSSCNVTFAEFPIQENTRLTVAVMMKIVDKAISSVRQHADILGSCKVVREPMRPFTLDDVL